MTPEDIHEIAVTEFKLRPKARADGWSYWDGPTNLDRILRVSRSANGGIAEIKLAATSNAEGEDVFLPTPFTPESIRTAIAKELALPRKRDPL